ncbi:MAG: hypothetical protein Q7S06_00825 [Nanoarchaeota archaeon]|nr:hypothetical protein [Nanoarchaeota archaeon]
MKEANNQRRLLLILILVIVVLLGIIAYAFVFRPALNGYVVKSQNEGVQYAVSAIIQQVVKCPTTGVPLTFGNVTINVVALECYSQQPVQ